jgi:drug/metabolite transporter (DMT)-like permease
MIYEEDVFKKEFPSLKNHSTKVSNLKQIKELKLTQSPLNLAFHDETAKIGNIIHRKDSLIVAVIAVNVFALAGTAMGTFFKLAKEEGVSVGDYVVYRCLTTFILNLPYMCLAKKNPFKNIDGSKCLLFMRSFFGLTNFAMYTVGLLFLPLALNTVLYNMAPFWASLLGLWINREPIIKLEYLAMGVCFVCVVGMTLGAQTSSEVEL